MTTTRSKILLALALAGSTTTLAFAAGAEGAALDRRTFEVHHDLKVMVPAGARQIRVWFAMPQKDPAQKVTGFEVEAPLPHRVTRDSEGNRELFFEGRPPAGNEFWIRTRFTLTRHEVRSGVSGKTARTMSARERTRLARYLAPNAQIVIDDRIRELASQIAGGETDPVRKARKLYDWVLDNVDYWVKDPKNKKASPVGSSEYCLMTRTGNCSDVHSLWIALARASGVPARMVYGSFFKSELDGQEIDQSYHCWPEFWVSGRGWVPHDVAIADIYRGDFETTADNEVPVRRTTGDGYRGKEPEKVEYYFGNLDARRVTWTRGRDLILEPRQAAGPVNALIKAYVEVDGAPLADKEGWIRTLTYREIKPR